MTALSAEATEVFANLRSLAKTTLTGRGDSCAESGSLEWNGGRLSIHSDYGPLEQDKETNQDAVVAWRRHDASSPDLKWAIAMADGVSSAWFAEIAAELVCWTALERLVTTDAGGAERGNDAIASAASAIASVAETIERDPEASRPDGEFQSTWEYTIRKGLLLQTTLCLAWCDRDEVHIAFIGDGGAVTEQAINGEIVVSISGDMDESSNRVHALGPKNANVRVSDVAESFAVTGFKRLALFTDGVSRGLSTDIKTLLGGPFNVDAKAMIEQWIATRPRDFDDNLSLATVVEGDADSDEAQSGDIQP